MGFSIKKRKKKKKNFYSIGGKILFIKLTVYSERIKKHTHILGHKTVPKVFPYKVTSQTNTTGLTQDIILTYISLN